MPNILRRSTSWPSAPIQWSMALSTIKLALMVLAYRDGDAGRFDFDARYTLSAADRRRGSGVLHTFAPDLQPTYRDLVTQMIITSDNTATAIMIARLGLARVNELLTTLGYAQTRLQTTTGALFRRLLTLADPAHQALAPEEVYGRGFPADADGLRRAFHFLDDPAEWLGRTTAREMGHLLELLVAGEHGPVGSPERADGAQVHPGWLLVPGKCRCGSGAMKDQILRR
jgi:hypothetical protein